MCLLVCMCVLVCVYDADLHTWAGTNKRKGRSKKYSLLQNLEFRRNSLILLLQIQWESLEKLVIPCILVFFEQEVKLARISVLFLLKKKKIPDTLI